MDCSCHKHARKPQQEDEFHEVVPRISPSSRILRTVAALALTFWTSLVDYFLLGARSQNKRLINGKQKPLVQRGLCVRKARGLGLQTSG